MIAMLHTRYESEGETAALSLSGWMRPGDDELLYRMFVALPLHIRTLRLNLHSLKNVDMNTVDAIRQLLHYWCRNRGGACRVSMSGPQLAGIWEHEGGTPAGTLAAWRENTDERVAQEVAAGAPAALRRPRVAG